MPTDRRRLKGEIVKEEVIEKILYILTHKIPEAGEIRITSENVKEPLQVDSLVFLQLLTEIEKVFQIHIEDDYWEYNKLNSVDVIAEYILKNTRKQK